MKNETRLAAILSIALLTACAETKTGSNGTGAVPTEREAAYVAGTLVGVESFSIGVADIVLSEASIRKDEDGNAGAVALRLGMSFEGVGTVLGPYGSVPVLVREGSALSAARGAVTSVDTAAQRFRMATLTITVDANTLYDGVAGLPALTAGTNIEVSGLLLADPDTLLATRIALSPSGSGLTKPPRPEGPAPGTRVEMEGIALDVLPSGAFTLRTPARDYSVAIGAATTTPVTTGARVRVVAIAAAGSTLNPSSATVVSGPIVYRVTGTVSEFASLASLRVRGEPVDLTTAVVRGGNASDIMNGRRLAVVGTAGPGALRVTEATLLQP